MIVDTSALYAILFDEPDSAHFIGMLASEQGNLSMSVATQVEAYVVAHRSGRPEIEAALGRMLDDYGIAALAVTPEAGRIAIEAHRTYGQGSGHPARLNFGDCFSYALAKSQGEPLLFKGKDFVSTDIASAF